MTRKFGLPLMLVAALLASSVAWAEDGTAGSTYLDVFAIGVVAYELVTGIRPFESATLSNVLYKILNEDPEYPTEIDGRGSEELQAVIRRCMAKEPDERYQTAAELLTDLPLCRQTVTGLQITFLNVLNDKAFNFLMDRVFL